MPRTTTAAPEPVPPQDDAALWTAPQPLCTTCTNYDQGACPRLAFVREVNGDVTVVACALFTLQDPSPLTPPTGE